LYITDQLTHVAGALSALTRTPENVLVEKGDDVYMECSTDNPNNQITWRYDGAQVVSIRCQSSDTTRYNTSASTTNVCNVISHASSASGNQGPYHCSDGTAGSSDAEAVAVLIGIYIFLVVTHETLSSIKG